MAKYHYNAPVFFGIMNVPPIFFLRKEVMSRLKN
jgi:hypothetical protein